MSFSFTFMIGDAVQTIIVQDKLGAGAYGTVYKALLLGYGEIALKEFSRNLQPALESVKTEAEIGELNLVYSRCAKKIFISREMIPLAQSIFGARYHRYVRISDIPQDKIYVMYDLINGITVETYINEIVESENVPSVSIVRQNILDLLYAVNELSIAGVAHGDIKPQNVMLERGKMVLLDFGMACFFKKCTGVKGTPLYMSPEITVASATNNFEAVEWDKVDVFMTGATIFFILVGDSLYNYIIEDFENVGQVYMFARKSTIAKQQIMNDMIEQTVDPLYIGLLKGMLNPNVTQRITLKDAISIVKSDDLSKFTANLSALSI